MRRQHSKWPCCCQRRTRPMNSAAAAEAAAEAAAAVDEHARCVDVEPAEAMEVEGDALGTASGAVVTPMVDAAMGSGEPCDQPRGAPPTSSTCSSTPTPLEEHFFSALTRLLDAHALHCVQRRPAA